MLIQPTSIEGILTCCDMCTGEPCYINRHNHTIGSSGHPQVYLMCKGLAMWIRMTAKPGVSHKDLIQCLHDDFTSNIISYNSKCHLDLGFDVLFSCATTL